MMKKFAPIFLFIIMIPTAAALQIDVEVSGKIGGYIEYFEMEEAVDGVQTFSVQWYNTESANCRTWMEFEIYENGKVIDTVWSEGKDMTSGVSRDFEAYWTPTQIGDYSAKIAVHHCNEIIESELMNFSVTSVPDPESIIEIEAENLPDKKIRVILKSNKEINNVIVVPEKYPLGWIFSAKKIEKLEPGKNEVVMEYIPSVWSEEKIKLQAMSLDGKYSSEKINFALEEKKYFWDEHGYTIFLFFLIMLILSLTGNFYLFLKKRKSP
jgi:hypothetical protein